jgi:hydrogenase nickel incorporation protein HypA/HybF
MHERALMTSLLRQAADLAVEHDGEVREICIEVGPLSGVEAALLSTAFAELRPAFALQTSRLTIDQVPLTVRCRQCQTVSSLADFDLRCPACQSSMLEIVAGDRLILKSVTLAQQPTPEGAR